MHLSTDNQPSSLPPSQKHLVLPNDKILAEITLVFQRMMKTYCAISKLEFLLEAVRLTYEHVRDSRQPKKPMTDLGADGEPLVHGGWGRGWGHNWQRYKRVHMGAILPTRNTPLCPSPLPPPPDFLPLFVWVLVQCSFQRAEIEAEYMWGLAHPSLFNGEAGYYLTTLTSAGTGSLVPKAVI